MAIIRALDVFPYSGWPQRPWGETEDDGPFADEVLDLDAAARSARIVTESLSLFLNRAGVQSVRSTYRMMLREPTDNEVIVVDRPDLKWAKQGFVGGIRLTRGFRSLLPRQRAEIISDAVRLGFAPLATSEGWVDDLDAALFALRDSDYSLSWASEWKSNRQRTYRVRLVAEWRHDGYARWHIEIANAEGDILRKTEPLLGWTWAENFRHAAKSLRYREGSLLEVISDHFSIQTFVNLESGEVTGATGREQCWSIRG